MCYSWPVSQCTIHQYYYTFITMPGFCFHVRAMGSKSDGETAQTKSKNTILLFGKVACETLNLILMMFKNFETNKRWGDALWLLPVILQLLCVPGAQGHADLAVWDSQFFSNSWLCSSTCTHDLVCNQKNKKRIRKKERWKEIKRERKKKEAERERKKERQKRERKRERDRERERKRERESK